MFAELPNCLRAALCSLSGRDGEELCHWNFVLLAGKEGTMSWQNAS